MGFFNGPKEVTEGLCNMAYSKAYTRSVSIYGEPENIGSLYIGALYVGALRIGRLYLYGPYIYSGIMYEHYIGFVCATREGRYI